MLRFYKDPKTIYHFNLFFIIVNPFKTPHNHVVAPPGWEAAMPGAYGTWQGTSPATGYRSSLLVVVASDLPQHFPFPLPLWDDPIVHRPFPPSSSPSCITRK
jgi:hypothetical protein